MEFGAALLQVWRDVGVKQLYLHDSSHLPHKKSLLNVGHFQNGGSGEGRLHFKLIQERFFFFLIRCIVHLSQNSFLPRTQTGRGETVVQSNEGWYKKIIIWFKWEQKYIRRKLKSMINLTIKACFISKHMSFFFCTLPYKMSINTYCFFVVFLSFNRLLFETQIWVTVFAASYTQKISIELLLDQNTGRYRRNPTSRIQISHRSISPMSVSKNARSYIRFLANCFNQSCQEEEYLPRSPKPSSTHQFEFWEIFWSDFLLRVWWEDQYCSCLCAKNEVSAMRQLA